MTALAMNILGREPVQLYQQGMATLAAGRPAEARTLLLAAAKRLPGDYEVRYALYSAIKAMGDEELASLALTDAMQMQAEETIRAIVGGDTLEKCRETAKGMMELAMLLYGKNQTALASFCCQEALAMDDSKGGDWVSLGLSLQHQGRIDEAEAVFRNVVERWPDNAGAHSFLHFLLFFGARDKMELTEEAHRWNQMHAARRMPATPEYSNDRNPDRRLKIGYFSPLFTSHQLTRFLEPVLANHDHEQVEIFCYSGTDNPADAVQQRITGVVDHWRPMGGATDQQFAEMVRGDGIDILVDLWGHTANNRLTAFALKPAPVQVSWLNYAVTTGLEAMDYVIHPDHFETPGEENYFSETVYHIGDILAPFQPLEGVFAPGPTPALTTGLVTFGCFNHPGKVNGKVIALWARILHAVPGSRLLFRYRYFEDLVVQRAFRARFEAHGIEGRRIEFGAFINGPEYIDTYRELDMALDTFPYQGGTTTLDALTAGVPVVSADGDWFRERVTPANLKACGLDELIAPDHDAYVNLAVDLATDLPRLDAIRQKVQPALDASPLLDAGGFTRKLEAGYREMFRTWCEKE